MFQRRRQAISKEQVAAKRKFRQQLLLRCTYTVLALSLILWFFSFLRHTDLFSIEHISIEGNYSKVNIKEVAAILKPYAHSSLITLDKPDLTQQLLGLPWIKSLTISRSWPHTLIIDITEQHAVARWKNKGLLTEEGFVFSPPANTFPKDLPEIDAPKDLLEASLAQLASMDLMLSVDNLQINSLIIQERNDVSLILQNGVKVLLGSDNVSGHLQRFVNIYPKVFEKRFNQVQYVDMRYTNGMAVKWLNGREK
jgi:cell division protein FtsQ